MAAGLAAGLAVCAGSGAAAQADLEGLTCLAPPYDAPATDRERRIADVVAELGALLSPYDSMSATLGDGAPEVCLADRLYGVQGYYETDIHRVVLSASLPRAMMLAVAIHELRHVHQASIGICPTSDLSMAATAEMTLAMEADASATSLVIAWRLQGDGRQDIWTALRGWRSHTTLADAFEAEMERSGDLAAAAAAAFTAWFDQDWLRDSYYIAACSAYLDRQDETHALPRYGALSDDYLDALCRLPSGRDYGCETPFE
ncbi:hypothetical protein HKCCE2091_15060 [Rhodobacterales bacterium HKCCE2091]|nr:hypothetical protein [Rhodobacterales bacterium HKCCE2091]